MTGVDLSNTALKVNLEAIKSYILPAEKGQTDHVIIREACNNVYNYTMRMELGLNASCQHPGYYYMSEKFYEESSGNYRGGIREHLIPMNIIKARIREKLSRSKNPEADLCEIYEVLKNDMKVVWITREEDAVLRIKGLHSRLPDDGSDRHKKVGINHCKNVVRVFGRSPNLLLPDHTIK